MPGFGSEWDTLYNIRKAYKILAYADDVAIVGRNKNALKDTLVNIENETRKWSPN